MTDIQAEPIKAVAPWWWPSMRDILAVLSTLIFAAAYVAPMLNKAVTPDPDLKGAIILQWGLVMGWYFGSSKASAVKDATIATMASTANGTGS